jgi:NTP pyrophosphatase (non-canonical NTP hydrolase)
MEDTTKEILQILNEECAETVQSISKCFRFGLYGIKPNKSISNLESLEEELGDVLAMIDLLVKQDIGITYEGLNRSKESKFKKLKCWSNIKL